MMAQPGHKVKEAAVNCMEGAPRTAKRRCHPRPTHPSKHTTTVHRHETAALPLVELGSARQLHFDFRC